MTRVVVIPWSNPNSMRGRVTALGITFGIPSEEPSGAGRRMAFGHPVASEDEAWVLANIANVQVLDALPADWRHPALS